MLIDINHCFNKKGKHEDLGFNKRVYQKRIMSVEITNTHLIKIIRSKEMKSNSIYYQVYLQGTPLCGNVILVKNYIKFDKELNFDKRTIAISKM